MLKGFTSMGLTVSVFKNGSRNGESTIAGRPLSSTALFWYFTLPPFIHSRHVQGSLVAPATQPTHQSTQWAYLVEFSNIFHTCHWLFAN